MKGIQKFHTSVTPRVGGLSVFISFFFGLMFLEGTSFMLWSILGISSVLCFLGGIYEDLYKNTSTKLRILLTFLSGVTLLPFLITL